MFTKIFFIFFAFLLPSVCIGENINIKLDCLLSYAITMPRINSNVKLNEIIEINQNNEDIFIKGSTGKIYPVSTVKDKFRVDIKNFSDKNKWFIINNYESADLKAEITINIDRNTGYVSIFQTIRTESSYEQLQGYGSCKVIDITKRLF